MRLRRGLPLLSSLAADMSNLVLDVMAGSLTASVPLPVSTLEGVSFRCLDLDQIRPVFAVSGSAKPKVIFAVLPRLVQINPKPPNFGRDS
jgi:hypothetical protein